MPRLMDLLEYMAAPGLEHVWLLLDIKVRHKWPSIVIILNQVQLDNDADTLIRLIASTIASVAPPSTTPWNKRIVLGCWAAKYLPLCAQHLPTYPITHIGFSIPYARQFLSVPNVSFNILQKSLLAPIIGTRFLKDAKRHGRPVYDWTVDEDSMMRWSIKQGLDGVITDDPKRFLEVCDEWVQGKRELQITFKQWLLAAWINVMVMIFGILFWWKYGRSGAAKEQQKGRKSTKASSEAPTKCLEQ